MSSNRSLVTFGYPVFLIALGAIVGCGGASPALDKDGGGGSTAAGGAGGDQSGAGGGQSGAGGDTSTGAGGASGAGGDMSTGSGGTAAAGVGGGAGGRGGESGAGGSKGAAGKGGGGGGATGEKDGGAGGAGAITTCKNATTCKAGDPPCLRACGTGKDVTCECGTGVLVGKLVCDDVCEKPDAGSGTDGGVIAACPAAVKSGTTACMPKTESMCETPCQNAMHRECVCTAVGGKSVWLCLKALACK